MFFYFPTIPHHNILPFVNILKNVVPFFENVEKNQHIVKPLLLHLRHRLAVTPRG
jgi:hypothetical protein